MMVALYIIILISALALVSALYISFDDGESWWYSGSLLMAIGITIMWIIYGLLWLIR